MKIKSLIPVFLISALLLVSVFFVISFNANVKAKDSLENAIEYRIKVPSGATAKSISKELYEKSLIKSDKVFYLGVRFPLFSKVFIKCEKPFSLKSGIYKISSAMSLKEIYEIFTSGEQEYIKISFPEGLTKSKIALKLQDAEVCAKDDFLKYVQDASLLSEYKIPSESFEGYLFPDTYFFTPMMSGREVVKIMVDNFFEQVKTIPNVENLTIEELDYIVRLASIVEREYRIDEEAPIIASVFKNRLKYDWGLYSCATVEYVITEILQLPHPDVITYKDLQIDSPYNTYKWAGLPPTAISNPGKIALDASVNTPKTKYFYFRLIDSSIGKHVFTKDFSEHINEGYSYSTKKSGK